MTDRWNKSYASTRILSGLSAWLGLGLVCLCCFGGRPQPSNPPQDTLQLRKQLSQYRTLLGQNGINTQLVHFNIAQCLALLDSHSAAATHYLSIINRLPPEFLPAAYNNIALAEYRLKNLKVALEYLKAGITANPNNEILKFNYELIRKQIQSDPPPPESDDMDSNPNLPDGDPKFVENMGKLWVYKALNEQQLRQQLNQLAQREEQYIHQLRKRVKNEKKFSAEPQW
jgi:tetratricopeptide (TPR) repeat protein